MAKEYREPQKRSFFERLTGSVKVENHVPRNLQHTQSNSLYHNSMEEEEEEISTEDAELSVDVYQTDDAIIIKTMVAGVNPNDLDIDIARDMVTIRGSREEVQTDAAADHFTQELYWGSFSRTISLPEEIEVEEATAEESHGLLTIRLPKIDKNKKTKLKIKSRE